MPMTSIAAALGSIKLLGDLVKSAVAARDAQAFKERLAPLQQAVIDAQGSMMDMQQEHSALIGRVRDLEAEIVQLKEWASERERYALTELEPGSFAYALKREASAGEPAHMLCAHCYQRREKVLLQGINSSILGWIFTCPACKTEVRGRHES